MAQTKTTNDKIFLVACTCTLQEYNEYYYFSDKQKAEEFTRDLIKRAKKEEFESVYEVYTEEEFVFYYDSSEGTQKIMLEELEDRGNKTITKT